MITEAAFTKAAAQLSVNTAAIKAVAEVESGGDGFIGGKPKILFEPHIFWQELEKVNHNPQLLALAGNSDILYKNWKRGAYGKTSEQHGRLERAAAIHREAALKSASWGKFQILGKYWFQCGVKSLQEFINAMYAGEDEHLILFCHLIEYRALDTALRQCDWKTFARGYNGKSYAKNKYDLKLADAYNRFLR